MTPAVNTGENYTGLAAAQTDDVEEQYDDIIEVAAKNGQVQPASNGDSYKGSTVGQLATALRAEILRARRMRLFVLTVIIVTFVIAVATLVLVIMKMADGEGSAAPKQETKAQDINECSRDLHSCDTEKKQCVNTVGSYKCECKAGYQGDGKTCIDIDECASGVHACHKNASCINTEGSYKCSCKNPYTGDGNTCNLAAECQTFHNLTSKDRSETYSANTSGCDSGIGPGWYRFGGAAGTRMPTSCPPTRRCNTRAPGWINGTHPAVADGQVSKTVCFHWYNDCCLFSTSIQVRNCGSYYVYFFSGTPGNLCSLRYCGTE